VNLVVSPVGVSTLNGNGHQSQQDLPSSVFEFSRVYLLGSSAVPERSFPVPMLLDKLPQTPRSRLMERRGQ
jgi:hypothetical protein